LKRIVLDTNVLLVSVSDRSPYHWIFQGLIRGEYELCVTNEIILEYAEIIEQHMGLIAKESVLGVLETLPNVNLVSTYFRFDLLTKDPDDNKFVDCAIASNSDFIVTEDTDFKALRTIDFPKVEIRSIQEFKEQKESGT